MTPEALVVFLSDMPLLSIDDDPRLKRKTVVDQDAVNILTIHASKGLEFDTVFTPGLIVKTKDPDDLIPKIVEGKRVLVINDEVAKENYALELDAEKARQLYVALTRAKYQVFCPLWVEDKELKLGVGSPMELFFQKCPIEQICQNCPHIVLKKFDNPVIIHALKTENKWDALIFPKKPNLKFPTNKITSFSQLNVKLKGSVKVEEELDEQNGTEKNFHTLPKGSQTGVLIHSILESIPLNLKSLESILSFIEPYVENTPFFQWKTVIAQMIYSALHTPLDGFLISDVEESKIVRETTFLLGAQEDMIKGVIDLVFERAGKYYLLDWKTNWLGSTDCCYDLENINRAMDENGYFLQAKIYSEALLRWISLFDKNGSESAFGGVFYLFLRGGKSAVWKKFNLEEINSCAKILN
jgi:exodeoxyribonuclease V beta subunit